LWGAGTARRTFLPAHWQEPIEWNRDAEMAGERRRVFCLSMGDVTDEHPTTAPLRVRLWELIEETRWLDWLLLSKWPERYARLLPGEWLERPRRNVWLGATGVDQAAAMKAWGHLCRVPARVWFLCHEPGLGGLDLAELVARGNGEHPLHWVITGGMSGVRPAPYDVAWPRRLIVEGRHFGVRIFVKQTGSWLAREMGLQDAKGEDPAEWAEELRVREIPEGAA
jgi:protein gp37